MPIKVESAARQVKEMEKNCREFGVELLGLGSEQRGIVHVIGPELGATQPGKTIVCGDSHTATHGAFGALAFGIGTTEVGHVLATQCLLQRRPKTLAIEVTGRLREAVTAKDLILAIIGKIGVSGGTGHVIEYRGSAIEALSMDERMTVCNMSIEAGARAGMIAPDETTFAYLKGRRFAPQGAAWDRAVERWRNLRTDAGARFDRVVEIDASKLEPMITYGTNPGMVVPITATVPDRPSDASSREVARVHGTARRRAAARQTDAGRVRRQLHERAIVRPGASRARAARPQGRTRRAHAGRARLAAGQARSRSARPGARSSRTPAPSGANPVARCASA